RREHYPSPYAILDIWVKYNGDALAAPPSDPASIAHLLQTPTAANLIRVFKLQERLKSFGREDTDSTAAAHVHVVGAGTMRADIIIEAIFENLEAKQQLFTSLEARAKPAALLATNTSSIPLEAIAAPMRDPGRLIGLHFFNPVARMMLVEIVVGTSTRADLIPSASAFTRQIDKLPLPVKSAPGFLVNRILAPYLMEAMRCVDEGISPETVDEAALAFG